MLGKKAASICIIIIGIIVAIPFNYIYGIDGFEVDIVWTIVGIVMTASGFYANKFCSIFCAVKVQVTV